MLTSLLLSTQERTAFGPRDIFEQTLRGKGISAHAHAPAEKGVVRRQSSGCDFVPGFGSSDQFYRRISRPFRTALAFRARSAAKGDIEDRRFRQVASLKQPKPKNSVSLRRSQLFPQFPCGFRG